MIPIYIIHYDKLIERKKYLSKKIPRATFVTEYSRDKLTEDHLSMYEPDKEIWQKQCKGLYKELPPYVKLNNGIISCSVGHIKTLKWASYLGGPTLILEDDALLCDNFEEELSKIEQDLNTIKWDVVFIGGAFDHNITKTLATNGRFLLKDHPASNTVCAYIVNPQSAYKLANALKKFTLPIDFAMNYVMKELNMKVWHVVPYIIREGTSINAYKSSQER